MLFFSMTDEGEADKEQTAAFLKKHGMTWPCGYGSKVTEAYGVSGYPTVFVVGADGKVFWNDEQEGELLEALEKAVAAAEKK